ncbi:MAG TPA: cytochrome c peroxidase [Gemmataceae bacterium]|jgi:cytochrome c peroxidase|nr:cytochrome c peroxidase [Gemmataceae bacterium]
MTRPLLIIVPILSAAILCAQTPAPIPADTLPKNIAIDDVPLGLGKRPQSTDNPLTADRVALGRQLFFDPILSHDKTVACATCHRPDHGFASPEARPRGIGGKEGTRRAPSLLNRAFGNAFFWDGRAKTLEEQALEPIANPVEMGSTVADAIKRLQADVAYTKRFAAVFDDGITPANLGKALASFERTLLRGDSPIDKFRERGNREAMTDAERHGLWLYESKGQCWQCHSGKNFSDESFHNTGVSWGSADLGRHAVTKADADRGKYKTPTLRGVKLTAPYMHDGSFKTLEEVVEFYNKGGGANPHLDAVIRPLELSKEELADLVAFLKAL